MTIDLPEDDGQLKPGDWVVLSTFYRGTGQSIAGSTIMPNGVFVAGYFSSAGTKALTDYWMQMFDKDPELLSLMKALHGNFFEDSIESTSVSSYWSSAFMDDVDEEYAYRYIMPTVAASKYVSSGFMDVTVTDYFSFTGDDGLVDRVYEDYSDKLAELYVKYRVSGLVDWAKETMGWGFRGQTFHLPGPAIGYANMGDLLTELGQNYSDGVTRAVLHGTPYTKSFNVFCSEWPGWLPFAAGSYGSSFTYREAYWQDFVTETGFMSRIQAVLQNGQAKIDLAVLIDKEKSFDFESKNRFQKLLDSGYSYHLVSESVLSHPRAVVTDGILAPEGPAYKALIVDQVHALSPNGMKKLAGYAEAGLPIVLYDSAVNGLRNVRTADTEEAVLEALKELGVTGYANYETPRLEATLYQDVTDGTNYYYLFNNAYTENCGMMDNAQGNYYKGIEKILEDIQVTLEGNGVPYRLDPYTGQVAKMADYRAGNGTVTFTIDRMFGGTGEYTITFASPENWGNYDGAFIEYGYGRDQVGAVIVNGTELPANNASDRVDVGTLLKMGENSITIRLHSTLYGRTYAEHSGYQDKGVEYGMGKGVLDPPEPSAYYNGLLRVRVVPYKKSDTGGDTRISSPVLSTTNDADKACAWYDLQGRKLAGKPTQKGVYIDNGKQMINK